MANTAMCVLNDRWPKIGLLYLVVFLTFFSLLGCVEKKNVYTGDDVNLPPVAGSESDDNSTAMPMEFFLKDEVVDSEEVSVSEEMSPECAIHEQGEMLLIHVPVPQGVEVSPVLRGRKLELVFSRPIECFSFPELPHGFIRDFHIASTTGNDLIDSLTIETSSDVQFLVERFKAQVVQVTLQERVWEARSISAQKAALVIQDVDFAQDSEGHLFVTVSAEEPIQYTPLASKDDQIRILFPKYTVPESLIKLYRLEKFSTQIRSAMLHNSEDGAEFVFSVTNRVPLQVDTKDKNTVFKFLTSVLDPTDVPNEETIEPRKDKGENASDVYASEEELQELTTLFPGMKQEYTGEKISIDLQDADVEHVLRLIGEVSGYNLILDENVSGKISLKLESIPWDQALDLVLLQKGLGMVRRGNILRVTTAGKLQEEQKQLQQAREAAMQAKQSLENLVPLQTEYIQVNYTTAAELESKVRDFLSSRGRVSQDARTNMLIVSDTPSNIKKVRSVVNKLDRAERQVMIEARVVYASDDFVRSLGLQWGGTAPQGELKEDQTRTDVSISGVQLPGDVAGFNVFGQLARWSGGDFFQLDARLQLGETKGMSKTVSSPRVVTLNNEQASIEQGTKIAVPGESESGGVTTEYVDAVLKLDVTPQITPDNKILLDLDIQDDAPISGGSDISTRKTSTKLIVNNGETIVIGGVQKFIKAEGEYRVPWAADIPVLGWLFKTKNWQQTSEELLIFIRPHVI